MRILCVSYEYPPVGGGGAPYCQGLAESLAERGHDVDVVTSGMSDLPDHEVRRGVQIHRVPCVRRHRHYSTVPELLTQLWPAYRKARDLHREDPYDVNHTHFVVPSGVTSWLLHARTGLPYVITAHGSDIPGYNPDRFDVAHRVIRPAWLRILDRAAAVHTPSEFLRDLLQQHHSVPVDVVPYGFDAPSAGSPDRAGRRDRILVASRLFERKGVQYLLRALPELDTGWEVVVAGDGPYLPALREETDRLGIDVRYVGFVDRDRLAELYRSSKIFVFPSIQENFPVVLLEAMAAGCAVVTTSAAGCAEVVGDAAVKTAPGDVDALKSALSRLLDSPEQIERLGRRARRRVEAFRWPRITERMEALLGHASGSAEGTAERAVGTGVAG